MRTNLELISELPDLKQLRYCNLRSHKSINKPIVVKIFALCISTAHFPYTNGNAGSIGTKRQSPCWSTRCPCGVAGHTSSGSVPKAAAGGAIIPLSWLFFENKGRKIETLGDSTQSLTGRSREVGREANSDGRTWKMELKLHHAASKGFEEPLSCDSRQSTITLYQICRQCYENKDISGGTFIL